MHLDVNNCTIYRFSNYTNEKDLGILTSSEFNEPILGCATNKSNSSLQYINHSGYMVGTQDTYLGGRYPSQGYLGGQIGPSPINSVHSVITYYYVQCVHILHVYVCAYTSILRNIFKFVYIKILFSSLCFPTMNIHTCLFTLRKYPIYCLTCHNNRLRINFRRNFYLQKLFHTISVLFTFQVRK